MADSTSALGRRTVGFYARATFAHIRSIVEYPADFWVMFASGSMWQILQFAFLSVLFANVPAVEGWGFHEMLLLGSFLTLSGSLTAVLFDGLWSLGGFVIKGDIDYRITRPAPVILQVASAQMGMQGFGEMALGTAMLVYGWVGAGLSPLWIPVALFLIACGVVIQAALVAVACGLNFWVKGVVSVFGLMLSDLQGSAMRMPLGLFPVTVRLVATFLVPVAFVNFIPVEILTGRAPAWWIAGPPLVAVLTAGLAALVYRLGLRSYDSAGH